MGNPEQARVERYLKRMQRVHGWLDHYSATFILTTAPGEGIFALDVFDDQHLNVDKSGYGDRTTFLQNVGKWTGNRSVEILQRSSLEVRPADILALVGACRLVSIDGGHTAECVDNDLRLIESVLMPMGVAVLDDFYNEAWPAVAAGGARYFVDPSTSLRPFAITPNKLYLARPAAHDFYHGATRASHARWHDKTVEAFGSEIDVFGCFGPYHHAVYARLKQAVENRAQRFLERGKRLCALVARPRASGPGSPR